MGERLKTGSANIAGDFVSQYGGEDIVDKISDIIMKHASSFEW